MKTSALLNLSVFFGKGRESEVGRKCEFAGDAGSQPAVSYRIAIFNH